MIFKFSKLDQAGRELTVSAGVVRIEAKAGHEQCWMGADEAAALAVGMMGECAAVVDLVGDGAVWLAFNRPETFKRFFG